MFWDKQIPKINIDDKNGITSVVELVSGKFNGVKSPEPPPNSWANDQNNHISVWIIRLTSKGSFIIPKTIQGINRSIYVLKNSPRTYEM